MPNYATIGINPSTISVPELDHLIQDTLNLIENQLWYLVKIWKLIYLSLANMLSIPLKHKKFTASVLNSVTIFKNIPRAQNSVPILLFFFYATSW